MIAKHDLSAACAGDELRASAAAASEPAELPSASASAAARPQQISVGGGDDAVSRIQLAARWAEAFAPHQGDSLAGVLQRFKAAYEYLDSVTHGVEPAALSGDAG